MAVRQLALYAFALALGLSSAPVPGARWGTLVARLGPGPDPNTYTRCYSFGVALPWLRLVHTWNDSTELSRWEWRHFRPGRLAAHCAAQAVLAALLFAL